VLRALSIYPVAFSDHRSLRKPRSASQISLLKDMLDVAMRVYLQVCTWDAAMIHYCRSGCVAIVPPGWRTKLPEP
jgi:hypothetical protein